MQPMFNVSEESPASVLQRANLLLSAFDTKHRTLSLHNMVRRCGLPKSTVHRTAHQMKALGWLTYEDGRYSIGTRMFELASLCTDHDLRESALPFMADLYRATNVMVNLAVQADLEVLYVEKIMGLDRIPELSKVGQRLPLHCSAAGKVLLAFASDALLEQVIVKGLTAWTGVTITAPLELRRELKTVVEHRVAFDREESARGISCVAAPVCDANGSVIAAISVTGRASDVRHAGWLAPAVQAATAGVSRRLRDKGRVIELPNGFLPPHAGGSRRAAASPVPPDRGRQREPAVGNLCEGVTC